MDRDYELKYHSLEETHCWFVARRNMILNLISNLELAKSSKILEIGCSGGLLLKSLTEAGFKNVYGVDTSERAIDMCLKQGIANAAVMNGENLRFENSQFDLVIASDVLEHVESDHEALREWHRVLKSDGKMIIFVPAFDFLWSRHDELNHHKRRYSRPTLIQKLRASGFIIVRNSYWNFAMFFPVASMRLLNRVLRIADKKNQLFEINPVLNSMLLRLLNLENRMLGFLNFPLGVSLFAICKK